MENTNILDIDYPTFIQLQNILDNPDTMKSFLEVLPTDCSCENVLISMELESKKYNMTPAKVLLTLLGSKGFGILHLHEWFQSIGLEKALVLFKKEEPLRIVVQPDLEVTVNEGGEISLTCIASSYPPPEYQWFKDDIELLLHVDSNLIIKSASVKDSGQYTCLVTKWNRKSNAYDWVYSCSSAVQVIPSGLHAYPLFYPEHQQTMPNFMLPVDRASSSVTSDQDEVMSSLPEEDFGFQPVFNQDIQDLSSPAKDSITIIRQPYVDGKISQGMSICLICEAVGTSLPVKYRWIKNGIPLKDKTSSYLILSNLYSDPKTGENKWKYQCEVYNEVCQVFSEVVVVELDEVNDTTPFVAYQKFAFMVANDTYDYLEHLRKPSADVKDLATLLSSMGFKVFAFRNLTLTEMRNAFDFFCKVLIPGCYALFFFAGHGFDICGQTYLQPVDSSSSYLKHESVCLEYILQCLQEKKPAANILLVDACRKLPPNHSGNLLSHNHGKIFKAEMKNNTICGYSTSFLRSSHESDNETNSVYVKHLKKYLTQNKCIQDILMTVNCEFAKDPQTSKIQFPTIKSTLAEKRKLGDPVQDTATAYPYTDIVNWCDIKRSVILHTHKIARIKAEIQVEFHHHKGVFCNGVDVHLFLLLEPDIDIFVLHDVEINLTFTSPALHTIPMNGVALKNLNLMTGERNFLLSKEILNIQKINTQHLDGNISLKYSSEELMQNIHFVVAVSKITKLQLSINHLRSNNVEECKNYTIIKNSFK